MYQIAKPLFFVCATPLHAGKGDDLGIVDLPIQREKHTDFPKIEGSGIKGAIREAIESKTKEIELNGKPIIATKGGTLNLVFGDPNKGDEHASAIGFSDARLLLFPVRSLKGVFAWVTCPKVLKRFLDELELICGLTFEEIKAIDFQALSKTVSSKVCLVNNDIILEEFGIPAKENPNTQKLAQFLAEKTTVKGLTEKLVVLDDDTFTYFVKYATEVITRIKIGSNGTVEAGPFNEEYLPAESILYAHVTASPLFVEKKKDFADYDNSGEEAAAVLDYVRQALPPVVQMGANATLAKGLIKMVKTIF